MLIFIFYVANPLSI